jgi:hypothetical protein
MRVRLSCVALTPWRATDVDAMFAKPEDTGEHWLQLTINDDWEHIPEGPDTSEPADLNLAKCALTQLMTCDYQMCWYGVLIHL